MHDFLLEMYNYFSLHLTGLRHRIGKLGELESGVKSVYRRSLEQTQADNTEVQKIKYLQGPQLSDFHLKQNQSFTAVLVY